MPLAPTKPTLVGRWGSHFTRTARIFAGELAVDYDFRIVRDLMSSSPADYGGNPALKMPALETPQGTWFGASAYVVSSPANRREISISFGPNISIHRWSPMHRSSRCRPWAPRSP